MRQKYEFTLHQCNEKLIFIHISNGTISKRVELFKRPTKSVHGSLITQNVMKRKPANVNLFNWYF